MQAHELTTQAITAANEEQRTALVPFITAGYPEADKFIETLKSIAAVGDVVEIGVPFSVRSRREGGMAKDVVICLVVTFFYWLFYSIGLSLGTKGTLPPWLAAWLPSVFFLLLAVTLILHRRRST